MTRGANLKNWACCAVCSENEYNPRRAEPVYAQRTVDGKRRWVRVGVLCPVHGLQQAAVTVKDAGEQKSRAWKAKNQIKREVRAMGEWKRLMPNRYKFKFGGREHFLDHPALFEDDKGDRVLISQPYTVKEPSEYIEKNKIQEWCDEHGISVKGSKEESWHFPGRTILLEFRVADADKHKEALQKYRV